MVSIILLFFIFLYLANAYIQTRKKQKSMECAGAREEKEKSEKKEQSKEDIGGYEHVAVAALIATVMGDTPYVIKRIYPHPRFNEKTTNWKISGRSESMMRRLLVRK
ncbi:MAG: hypothetical protein N3B18_02540 [Desulfobacterota bacterium]|nr:hypothetical protein [Thermodesulfobacteriota bacterium]